MPLYTYECAICKGAFDTRHSIKEKLDKCELCGESGHLQRIPSMPFVLKKDAGKEAPPGSLVKGFIEEARQELDQEKRNLRQRGKK